MSETQAIHQLQERVNKLEIRVEAMGVKEVRPTKKELKEILEARKDIAEGNVISWEEVKKRHG